jgi:hypothetical protein
MSTPEAGRIVALIDHSSTTECLAFATDEARRRCVELVVVTTGAPPALGDAELVVTGPALYPGLSSCGRPIVVVRPGSPVETAAPVVIRLTAEPVNPVMDFAFTEASLRACPVRAIHVQARLDPRPDPFDESNLHELLERWAEKYPGVAARLETRSGVDAGVAFTVASRSAQLVVVGGCDIEGPASIGATLVRRAGCPVAIVAGS